MIQDKTYWQNRELQDLQRDWGYNTESWLADYQASANHPHRQVIIDELRNIASDDMTRRDFESLLEIGCNCGPNLYRIDKEFPKALLRGIDPSADAIDLAKRWMPFVSWEIGTAQHLPYEDKSIDVILADASLMYVPPFEIKQVMDEISRVAKIGVIIVERFNESEEGENNGHIWARNYTKLLRDRGFEVKEIKMTEELWPGSPNWQKYGKYFIATRS